MTRIVEAFADPLPGISPGIYGADDFHAIADMVHEEAGIVLSSGKAMLVYSRIAPLVRASGLGTFAAYIDRIRDDGTERGKAIGALTTNHTFFYREAHHFTHFANEVRPRVLSRLNAGQPVRLWSAGCSSGEETWSLVLTLLGEDRSEGARIAQRDLRILASDIAAHALRKAAAGEYAAQDLDPVPARLRQNWTVPQGDALHIGDEARRVVRFRPLNLQDEWPITRPFDAIFCRNVMIYFDQETKERLIERFARQLAPGGFLYIGHSERATGPGMALLEPAGPTIYRRRG